MITIKVDQLTLIKMKDFYRDFLKENSGEYVFFMADVDGLIVTAYSSKKEIKKVTFKGNNALNEALIWDKDAHEETPKEKEKEHWVDFEDQIGSDEVGVADFVGPMIVVAAYVTKKDIKYLIELGVHDSKKITDDKIKEIVPKLLNKVEYSKLTLPNEKYNEMISKGENLNSLKAKMHNRALFNLASKHPDVVGIYVDQFVSKNKFYEYLNNENEPIVKDISFKTKGESSFPCVAVASLIARYSFLDEMDKLSSKYKMNFVKGCSGKVNEFATKFIKKYGLNEFMKVCKANFSNLNEVVKK